MRLLRTDAVLGVDMERQGAIGRSGLSASGPERKVRTPQGGMPVPNKPGDFSLKGSHG